MAAREEPTFKLDAAVKHAIAACDGDAEVAVRWLIVANNRLAQDLEYALQQTCVNNQSGCPRRPERQSS